MNTVRHLNDSRLPSLPKRRLTFWNKRYLATAILASLLGTYFDLYFVGKGMYQFPFRPLPEIFPINIAFTIVILPIFTMIFLFCYSKINKWGRIGLIVFISLLMPILERFVELFGLFSHSDQWEHIYTFFGYLVFLTIISAFYHWLETKD